MDSTIIFLIAAFCLINIQSSSEIPDDGSVNATIAGAGCERKQNVFRCDTSCTFQTQFYLCTVVRKKTFHTALFCFLGLGLLFNQVGLHFFHDQHEAHEWLSAPADQAQYHTHGEHCKLCATDTLFTLFFEQSAVLTLYPYQSVLFSVAGYDIHSTPVAYSRGRAPPFILV
jgi:hypothetical protein